MDDDLRAQIYNELSLRETEDLIKIWQEKNLDEYEKYTFEMVREILLERLGYLPSQSAQSVEVQLEDLLDRIEENLLAENLDQASKDCELVIQIAPDRAEAYNYRGVIFERRGDLARAAADFRRALQLDSLLKAAQDNLHMIEAQIEQSILGGIEKYFEAGEYDKALEDCQLAIQMVPELAIAYNYRGIIYDELGKPAEAIADYQRALQLDPDLADAQENLEIAEQEIGEGFGESVSKLHLDQALKHLTDDEIEMAVAECELARKTLPPIASAHNMLGILLEESGEIEAAILEYQEAIRLNPHYHIARENHARAFLKLEEAQYRPSTSEILPSTDEGKEAISDNFIPLASSVYASRNDIPGWLYLNGEAFLLTGWAGHRTRPGRFGLDPLDIDFELSHMEGVVFSLLLKGRFRTHNPFYLLIMIFLGLFYCLPLLFLGFAFLGGEWSLVLVTLLYSPYAVAGVALLVNVCLSLGSEKPAQVIENGNSFF
ncbi:MAG: tetratricopeptide repeat protein [Anaerolineales bacterium]